MIRISTIFIAICMVLIAASFGMLLYSVAGLNVTESAVVALAALTFLILYNAVSMRLRDRSDVGGQIADLSRGTADLARQVGEVGRRITAMEARLIAADSSGQERIKTVSNEIGELASLMNELASSIAAHEDILANVPPSNPAKTFSAPEVAPEAPRTSFSKPIEPSSPVEASKPVEASRPVDTPPTPANVNNAQMLVAVKNAIEANRLDIYLQPMVTLPQRKIRFYEAMSRLRDDKEQVLTAGAFIGPAETAGLMGQIDNLVLLRCVQVLRRLTVRNKDVGVFCNLSAATLSNPAEFNQCRDFLDANRALAPHLILEFKQNTFRHLGPLESEHLATLKRLGYGFSIDNVTDLRVDGRDLADRGVRFMKVPANLLLDQKQLSSADIHAADLSNLLGRFGIDLVAERIEGERSVVDLLDYDVRFGQGFLFSPPRPLRPENAAPDSAAEAVQASSPKSEKAGTEKATEPVAADHPRLTGNAALVRRASALT
ncbi:EAL domain-containing protein [Bradyrhizobium sp. SYSU BS000235]|uniref:EAL domain-containing protein n=1 Tax=Bradyrhizobium sp. SYSU BS000235 TaxID=3411332 RepID=UPI003C78EDA0